MNDPNILFQHAGALSRQGRFNEAVAIYRGLLDQLPGQPQILAALGNVQTDQGNLEDAVASFRQSLAADETQPDAWCNLARALRLLRCHDEALRAVHRSLALAPGLFEAWVCRGNIVLDMGKADEALESYGRALALRPGDPRIHFNRANVLRQLKRNDEAVDSFTRAISIDPNYADACKNLAILLLELGRHEEALACIDRAVVLRPDDPQSYDRRGAILHELARFDEAVAAYNSAISMTPTSSAFLSNRGISLHGLNRFDEALADFDRAIALDPANADAIANRGTMLMDLMRLDEAAQCCDRALTISPRHRAASWNKGFLALLHGDFASGLPLYEWRWQQGPYNDPLKSDRPQWKGEDIAGKTVMVWCEQGFGDYLQFCRYVPLLNAKGARVVLETLPRLRPLIERLKGDFVLMGPEARQAEFDLHCPIMSLPLLFGTRLGNIPAGIPYLSADPAKTAAFDAALGAGLRIGVVWSSSHLNIRGRARNMAPAFLEPLLDLPFAFHVLQKDLLPQDESWLASHPSVVRHDAEQNDFSDAAALVEAMDVILTVDTAVAHLAGALGKAVWLMLPYAPDWRWMLHRSDSPWYPTMRIFRQSGLGDWASVVAEVRTALLADPAAGVGFASNQARRDSRT